MPKSLPARMPGPLKLTTHGARGAKLTR
jgi:hypothetical protein